jgi:ATP-dependent exoDNAse (exonuclease V) beta subunit
VRIDGRLDRLCLDPIDQRWMVVDYKTEDPGTMPAERAAHHRVQLLTYSVAASRVLTALGTPPVARAAVLFTRTGELVRLADWTPDDAAWLEARVAELVAQWSALPVAG